MLNRIIRKVAWLAGYAPIPDHAAGASSEVRDTIDRCRPYTTTSAQRIMAVCDAVEYVVRNGIPGDFVECGVWKGGSSMAAALTYLRLGKTDINLRLYDTYEGMSEPTAADVTLASRKSAKELLAASNRDAPIWCYSPYGEVEANLSSTGYPKEHIHLIKGKVEDTIPSQAPDAISVLRLDTDWYESTKHELVHLFPRLSPGGVLILDDYGFWAGARKAVDEYIAEQNLQILLGRIDYTGRIAVKLN